MRTPHIQDLCKHYWPRVERPRRGEAVHLPSRTLYEAIHKDMEGHAQYDPESDRRVAWLRQVVALGEMRAPWQRGAIDPALHAVVGMLLGRTTVREFSGKDLAAGEAAGAR